MSEADEDGRNPRLQNRLPREDKAIIVPFDDRPPLIETAKMMLGGRLKITRDGFFLDRKPVNTRAVIEAAGLKFKDEA